MNATDTAHRTPTSDHSPADAPLLVWLAIQLIALAALNTDIELLARPPHPIERDAVWLMLGIQFTASSFLFPWLLQNSRSIVFVMLATVPFLQLAAVMEAAPLHTVLEAAAFILLWLLGLTFWVFALASSRQRAVAVAVFSAIAVGGGCAAYLHQEFAFGPNPWGKGELWWVVGIHLVLAGLGIAIRRTVAPSYPPSSTDISTGADQN